MIHNNNISSTLSSADLDFFMKPATTTRSVVEPENKDQAPVTTTTTASTSTAAVSPTGTDKTVTVVTAKPETRFGKAVAYAKSFFEKGLGTLNPKNIYETSKFVKIGGNIFKGLLTGLELVARAIYTVAVTILKIVGVIVAVALALTVGAIAVAAFPITVPAYLGYKMNKQLNRIEQGVLSLNERVTNLEIGANEVEKELHGDNAKVYGPKVAKLKEETATVQAQLVDLSTTKTASTATVAATENDSTFRDLFDGKKRAAVTTTATAVDSAATEVIADAEKKEEKKAVRFFTPISNAFSTAGAAISTAASKVKGAFKKDEGQPIEMKPIELIDVSTSSTPAAVTTTTSTVARTITVPAAPVADPKDKFASVKALSASITPNFTNVLVRGIEVPSAKTAPSFEDLAKTKRTEVAGTPSKQAETLLAQWSADDVNDIEEDDETSPLISREQYLQFV